MRSMLDDHPVPPAPAPEPVVDGPSASHRSWGFTELLGDV